MAFSEGWHALQKQLHDLPDDTTLITPLSKNRFRVADVLQQLVVIKYLDRNTDEFQLLRRNQFETLHQRITDEKNGFDLDRLPPNAEPYAAILSFCPCFQIDERAWVIERSESQSASPFVEYPAEETEQGRRDAEETERDRREDDVNPTIREMINNMGDPPDRVTCPIDTCNYSHRSAASVARHVSGSSTDKHIWESTDYAGWRDFVRKHGESPGSPIIGHN